jgi:hypothetical protein
MPTETGGCRGDKDGCDKRMRTAACWIIAGTMTTGIIVGQQRRNGQVKALTVCEVPGDLPRYANTAVAVVGRLERSASAADHYEFLTQDECEHPVITYGHAWSDKIQVWMWEAGMPKPPRDRLELGRSDAAAHGLVVRRAAARSDGAWIGWCAIGRGGAYRDLSTRAAGGADRSDDGAAGGIRASRSRITSKKAGFDKKRPGPVA